MASIGERIRELRDGWMSQQELAAAAGVSVELVRKLELSGWEIAEVGVHHYPRLYGRSQFFRVKSLAVTLVELLRLWWRQVALR